MGHKVLQGRVTVPCVQKGFVFSAISPEVPEGNRLWKPHLWRPW